MGPPVNSCSKPEFLLPARTGKKIPFQQGSAVESAGGAWKSIPKNCASLRFQRGTPASSHRMKVNAGSHQDAYGHDAASAFRSG